MLFNRNIEPSCAYCRHGTTIGATEVVCMKYGIVSPDGFCRKFKYDPLKREPIRRAPLNVKSYSEEDFKL